MSDSQTPLKKHFAGFPYFFKNHKNFVFMASERFFDGAEHEKMVSEVPENFFERSSYDYIYDYNFVLVASERITKLRKFLKFLIFLKI